MVRWRYRGRLPREELAELEGIQLVTGPLDGARQIREYERLRALPDMLPATVPVVVGRGGEPTQEAER